MKNIIFDEQALKVLSSEQQKLRVLLEELSSDYFIAGGTAIALQLGHRKSIDFDFFKDGKVGSFAEIIKRINGFGFDVSDDDKENFRGIEFENQDEIHLFVNGVKISLINYYRTLYDDQKINIKGNKIICNNLKVPNLEELACMKLYAMISRNKWKDAVDLYFIIKNLEINLKDLLKLSDKKYVNIFNKKAVLEQLISGDWDVSEQVEYLIDNPPEDIEVIDFLKDEGLKNL